MTLGVLSGTGRARLTTSGQPRRPAPGVPVWDPWRIRVRPAGGPGVAMAPSCRMRAFSTPLHVHGVPVLGKREDSCGRGRVNGVCLITVVTVVGWVYRAHGGGGGEGGRVRIVVAGSSQEPPGAAGSRRK